MICSSLAHPQKHLNPTADSIICIGESVLFYNRINWTCSFMKISSPFHTLTNWNAALIILFDWHNTCAHLVEHQESGVKDHHRNLFRFDISWKYVLRHPLFHITIELAFIVDSVLISLFERKINLMGKSISCFRDWSQWLST